MVKLFSINEQVKSTGFVNGVYDISSLSKIRVVTEEAGASNTFVIKARIIGESGFNTTLGSIVGDADRLFTVSSYDQIRIDCTVFDSTTNRVKLLSTGFFSTDSGVQKVADSTERLQLSAADGDLVLQLDNNTLYVYDEPTLTWINTATSSVDAEDITFDNSGTNLVGTDLQATTVELDTRTFGKQYNVEPVITLSGGDITNKYIVLTGAPTDKPKTRVFLVEGVAQEYTTDFIVTTDDGGKRLSWDGLGLETLLTAGDKLLVSYN